MTAASVLRVTRAMACIILCQTSVRVPCFGVWVGTPSALAAIISLVFCGKAMMTRLSASSSAVRRRRRSLYSPVSWKCSFLTFGQPLQSVQRTSCRSSLSAFSCLTCYYEDVSIPCAW